MAILKVPRGRVAIMGQRIAFKHPHMTFTAQPLQILLLTGQGYDRCDPIVKDLNIFLPANIITHIPEGSEAPIKHESPKQQ